MIRAHELTKYYGSHAVLNNISLEVRKGEVAAIIGPSGVGKSTLLRCITGLEPFHSGFIECGNAKLTAGLTEKERARARQGLRGKIGMVFQQFHLFPHMSVLENVIAGPLFVKKMDRDAAIHKAEHLLERVGVLSKINCKPERLSGGEQQRVAIARALAMDPEIILFDEPTSALDPFMTDEVLSVMMELARAGQTMLVITHEMAFARRVAQTVHVFSGGKVIESGMTEQLFNNPQEAATKRFLRL